MKDSIRKHLRDAFSSDASALRMRAQAVAAPGRGRLHGPDAETSLLMADACEKVVQLVSTLPADEGDESTLDALHELMVPLVRLSKEASPVPQVRSVYLGAISRIEDILSARGALRAGSDEIRAPKRRPPS